MSDRPDLSKDAIKRAVLSDSLQHPAVIYPAVLGTLGGLGAVLLATSPVVLVSAIAAGGLALAGFGVNYFIRHDRIAGQYLARAQAAIAEQRKVLIKDLEEDLQRYQASDAIAQLERLNDKIATFQVVLGEKLKPSELTYSRFLAIAEEVYLSGVENLRSIALAKAGIAAIDEEYLRDRIAKVEVRLQRTKAQDSELASLKSQLDVSAKQNDRINDCMAQNEGALAELDKTIASISEMRTGGRASMDMESAMAELARIAARAKDYQS